MSDPIVSRLAAQVALTVHAATLPATDDASLTKIKMAQEILWKFPQIDIQTEHIIHGGLYARTIRLDAGVVLTGALIKVPTLLLVVGRTAVFVGDRWIELEGTQIIPASAGRKQIFVTREPTTITMTFRTGAKTVEEAEREFTDEADLLMSKNSDSDIVTITGE